MHTSTSIPTHPTLCSFPALLLSHTQLYNTVDANKLGRAQAVDTMEFGLSPPYLPTPSNLPAVPWLEMEAGHRKVLVPGGSLPIETSWRVFLAPKLQYLYSNPVDIVHCLGGGVVVRQYITAVDITKTALFIVFSV